jgi:hypothetical protein
MLRNGKLLIFSQSWSNKVNPETAKLLGWIGGQLHAACSTARPPESDSQLCMKLFVAFVLRCIAGELEQSAVARTADPMIITPSKDLFH